MRREEIFDLTWLDVDLQNRRINIRKSKMGISRLIVMTFMASTLLHQLKLRLLREQLRETPPRFDLYSFKDTDRILYPMAKATAKRTAIENAIDRFEDELWKVRERAGLYDPDRKNRWTFKVLRREAEARFIKCLLPHETARMMGYAEAGKQGSKQL